MNIFLSYSRDDAQQANDWVANLENFGYRVWIDRAGIRGGQQWNAKIVRSIKEAQALILLLSPNSARSDNVRREIDLAVEAKKRIIPSRDPGDHDSGNSPVPARGPAAPTGLEGSSWQASHGHGCAQRSRFGTGRRPHRESNPRPARIGRRPCRSDRPRQSGLSRAKSPPGDATSRQWNYSSISAHRAAAQLSATNTIHARNLTPSRKRKCAFCYQLSYYRLALIERAVLPLIRF